MPKPTLSSYIRGNLDKIEKKEPGPFITASRQYGCDGYELGDLLVKKLNERADDGKWRVFKKELLKQLAQDTGLTEEVVEKERLSKPSLLKDFFRGMRHIIGQGGTAATADLDGGLSVRIEGPKEWRIARVSVREKLTRAGAVARIEEIERRRKHLRKIYEQKNPREPAFNLVLDNSMFNIDQLADQIIFAMEQKKLIDPR